MPAEVSMETVHKMTIHFSALVTEVCLEHVWVEYTVVKVLDQENG